MTFKEMYDKLPAQAKERITSRSVSFIFLMDAFKLITSDELRKEVALVTSCMNKGEMPPVFQINNTIEIVAMLKVYNEYRLSMELEIFKGHAAEEVEAIGNQRI